MMPALSHVARPLPRLPALFDTSVRSRTPRSTTPRLNASGFPEKAEPAAHDDHAIAQRCERFGDGRYDLVPVLAGHFEPNATLAASPNDRIPVTSSWAVMHKGGAKIAVPRLPSTCSDSLRFASSPPSTFQFSIGASSSSAANSPKPRAKPPTTSRIA